ncbi:RNA-binding S4 domain-containing protein [Sphingomonas quercus]|uniref:RNA-binding S4 domain-containing protein n=1 Tax=Sphingomonas quercus TaxID=2842451 RepID=A0ABS6BJJ8_9SPHN|nr:RNA-binding S4 domain-containing protein [Sphingomonas quercus]MBU3078027.1 RNA-binding S4 domain-containing protein [Sphingomonas quercus]
MAEGIRLDLFLWFARLAKTRGVAQAIIAEGHLRLDGRATDRAHATVRVGSVLALPLHGRVRVFRVLALPARRGPASEAQALYADLSPPRAVDESAPGGIGQPANSSPDHEGPAP